MLWGGSGGLGGYVGRWNTLDMGGSGTYLGVQRGICGVWGCSGGYGAYRGLGSKLGMCMGGLGSVERAGGVLGDMGRHGQGNVGWGHEGAWGAWGYGKVW